MTLLAHCQDCSAVASIWSVEKPLDIRMGTLEQPLISNWLSSENRASVAGYMVTPSVVCGIVAFHLCVSLPGPRGKG